MTRRRTAPTPPLALALVGTLVAALLALVLGARAEGRDERAANGVGASSTASTPSTAGVSPVSAPQESLPMTTEVGIGRVAGRLDDTRRRAVKAAVTGVVDRYLDAAFVAGPWPREDFSAAFADFRRGAARDGAGRDLDLLTNHDLGASLSSVSATKRRLRIDVLAPRGRPGAVTAGFVVELDLASAGRQRVAGRLYLTRQRGSWKVFGYDVQKGVT